MVSAFYNDVQAPQTVGNSFVYDQLNRLVESRSFDNLSASTNLWPTGGAYNGMFENNFGYDANGNIETQVRKDAGGNPIDNLTYRYQKATNGQLLRNRLYHVNDDVGAASFTDDIDDMGTFQSDEFLINTANNYSYDALGQLTRDEQENIIDIQWRNDGKISSILRGSGGTESSLVFTYNPMGQRLSKEIYDENDAWVETTYYIRDAQGNVMSTYLHKSAGASETIDLTERHIYGSSRLGLYKEPVSMLAVGGPPAFQYDIPGYRHYELSNHLGNVTTIITGQKLPILSGSTLTGYKPQIVQSMDYSPFGVTRLAFDVTAMSTTHPVGDGYRYGFQGQEKDDEIKGSGNSVNYKYRMHDPRLGRWLSLDPLGQLQPGWSAYKYGLNNPIIFTDPDGNTEFYSNGKWIGTDGINNNVVAKVTSGKVQREIKKYTRKGLNYSAQSINKAAEAKNGMLLINKDVLNYSFQMLKKSLGPDGKVGEYANTLSKDGDNFNPVEKDDRYERGKANILPLTGDVSLHSHPTGMDPNTGITSQADAPSDDEPLNPGDESAFKKFDTNILVGKNNPAQEVIDSNGKKSYD